MMRGIMYHSSATKDIEKFCQLANCQKKIEYTKVKTATNDPGISQNMRYAQYLRQRGVSCSKSVRPDGTIVG
jgi:hypothetical protein